jgi:8-oxo-dGTP pyrophosphatase MutT (NUDIX family)
VKIKDSFIYLGKKIDLVYEDVDSFDDLFYEKCKQVYGVCFYEGKIVLGFSRRMQKWNLIGGTIGPGETLEQALSREIHEESNMKLLKCWPIGYQREADKDYDYQLRYACLVEPYGEFTADPDAGEHNGIDRITLIDPKDFKKYLGWGKIGDRLLERAIGLARP